jgi:hypothetical protein
LLCFSDPRLPDRRVIRLCDKALPISHPIEPIVMKRQEHTVLAAVDIRFQVAETLLDGTFECAQGVFRSGLVISPVGKSQNTLMFQKCVFRHCGVLAS